MLSWGRTVWPSYHPRIQAGVSQAEGMPRGDRGVVFHTVTVNYSQTSMCSPQLSVCSLGFLRTFSWLELSSRNSDEEEKDEAEAFSPVMQFFQNENQARIHILLINVQFIRSKKPTKMNSERSLLCNSWATLPVKNEQGSGHLASPHPLHPCDSHFSRDFLNCSVNSLLQCWWWVGLMGNPCAPKVSIPFRQQPQECSQQGDPLWKFRL